MTLDGEYRELPPEKVVNKDGTEIQLLLGKSQPWQKPSSTEGGWSTFWAWNVFLNVNFIDKTTYKELTNNIRIGLACFFLTQPCFFEVLLVDALLGPIVSQTMSEGLPTCCSLMGRTCFPANLKVGQSVLINLTA